MKEQDIGSSWFVLVNPNAGRGKGGKDWELISRLLKMSGFTYSSAFTQKKYHAIELTAEFIEKGFRKIIVVGGDGTLNEVMNGIFNQERFQPDEIILGMIPVGTGNDWGRMFNIPKTYEGAISVLKDQKIFSQDAGIIKYIQGDSQKLRYFINIAGLGFDAKVVQKTNRQKDKGRKGVLLYFYNILSSLLSYNSTNVSITIDDHSIKDEIFTISIGNGKFCGGGMLQTPGALPDDGLFDMTIIKKMRKFDIIRNLKKLYDGTILDHPRIEGFTGKKIFIDSDPVIYAEVDGESLGNTPVEFEILPKSLKVIIGKV